MSWSISFIGTPENINKALDENSTKLSGVSKEEYDAALPHMKALVSLNHNDSFPVALKIIANGHAYNGYSNCSVNIESSGVQLV